jgi:hypothetical protein
MNLLAVNPAENVCEIEHDFLPHLDEWNFFSLRHPGVNREDAEPEKCGELFLVEELTPGSRLGLRSLRRLPASGLIFHDG